MRITNLSASVSLRLLLKSATTVVGGKGGASEAPGRDCATLNKRPAYLFFCQIISRSDLSTTRQTTKPQDACHQHFQHQKCLFRNFPYKNIPGGLKGSPTYKVISKGVSPVRSSSSWHFCCSLSHCILLRLRLARLITTNGK